MSAAEALKAIEKESTISRIAIALFKMKHSLLQFEVKLFDPHIARFLNKPLTFIG